MKLYYNRPSPYARKVLVVIHEKQLVNHVELCQTDPWSDPGDLLAITPLGKVPVLVTDQGSVLTESTAISEYLDGVGDGRLLTGKNRFDVMTRVGIAQGLMDAAFTAVIERRRPPEHQWQAWIERQRRAISRTLPVFAVPPRGRFDLGDVSLACGLAYLDFRLPSIAWRDLRPDLARWLDHISERTAMQATAPQ